MDDLVLTGPALDVRGRAAFAEGRPTLLRFGRLKAGRSDMTGQVQFPPKPGAGPIAATVAGPVLDVSSRLTRKRIAVRAEAAATRKPRGHALVGRRPVRPCPHGQGARPHLRAAVGRE